MAVRASIGFAQGQSDLGVAYVALRDQVGIEETVRVPFRCHALPALSGRDTAYAALLAVAEEVKRRGHRTVAFAIDQEEVVRDVADHRSVPAALAVPYVQLGCALNRYGAARVDRANDATCRDLTARARAEVALNVAA